MFALADERVQLVCLPECHPGIGLISFGNSFAPQQQHIDSAVWNAVVSERACDPPFHVARFPRLVPRPNAIFKVADDPIRYASIDVRTAVCHGLLLCENPGAHAPDGSQTVWGSKCQGRAIGGESPTRRAAEPSCSEAKDGETGRAAQRTLDTREGEALSQRPRLTRRAGILELTKLALPERCIPE